MDQVTSKMGLNPLFKLKQIEFLLFFIRKKIYQDLEPARNITSIHEGLQTMLKQH